MPRLSDTMTEGVVAKWHKKIGDTVNEGDLLAEIETDKATMEFEAFPGQEGKLLYIGTGEGETAPVDTVLAILGDEGEDIEALKAGDAAPAAAPAEEAAPAPAPEVASAPEATPAPAPAAAPAAAPAPAPAAPVATDGSVKASPLARK
jgi:pyruvate dehydrogenase E2 component (dihydrolipoamide acetyltransferase)